MDREKIRPEVWVGWIAAGILGGAGFVFLIVSYAFANFETKEHAKETNDDLRSRLVRMEDKIDELDVPRRMPASKRR